MSVKFPFFGGGLGGGGSADFIFMGARIFLKLVRISGSFFIFPVIIIFSAHLSEGTQTLAITEKREEHQEILTNY